MKKIDTDLLKSMRLYYPLKSCLSKLRQTWELNTWEKKGYPNPPPHLVKQRILQKYAKEFNLKVLVETGTYYGDMIEAQLNYFDKIYSIELSPTLFSYAAERFRLKPNVEVIQGDSGIEIKKIMKDLKQPALFWLDGHYSSDETARGDKDTPILEELECILKSDDLGHVIIIDDARLFGSDPAYPSLEAIEALIHSRRPALKIKVSNDSIRITPG